MGTANNFQRFSQVDNANQDWLFNVGDAIAVGDLMYYTSGDKARPADKLATLTTEELDQKQFADLFIGVSRQQILSTETNANKRLTLRTYGVADFKCPSQTWNKGDLVGIFSDGANLDPQQVDKVSLPVLAIGTVTKYYSAVTTTVRIAFFSKYTDRFSESAQFAGVGGLQGHGVTALADAAATLTVKSDPILNMVPTAARNVTLPTEAQSKQLKFYFTNNSAGAFSVTFKASDGATAIKGNGVVPQNKTGIFWCDGTNWNGMVSA